MQVRKFEANSLQEALDTIKRELGPEAVILQTRKHRRAFGLMSKASIEVTAAVSEKAIRAKKSTDARISKEEREQFFQLSADAQQSVYEKQNQRSQIKSKLQKGMQLKSFLKKYKKNESKPKKKDKITATRYVDITDSSEQEVATVSVDEVRDKIERKVQAPNPKPPTAYIDDIPNRAHEQMKLAKEVEHLKSIILELKNEKTEESSNSSDIFRSTALKGVFDQLVINGMDRSLAFQLVKSISFEINTHHSNDIDLATDYVASEIVQNTEVFSIWPENTENQVVIALVGPTGVGKTTTAAKIASSALVNRGMSVGLINLDCYKVAAPEQLATYAKLIGAPFRSVKNSDEISLALKDFKNCKMVIIDCTGRSQRDGSSLNELERVLHAVPDIQTHLVVSSTTRDVELLDVGKRFQEFRPSSLVISKLDESVTFGSIYNVSQQLKLPLSFFTTGQRVPEDLEEASKERVASLILNIE